MYGMSSPNLATRIERVRHAGRANILVSHARILGRLASTIHRCWHGQGGSSGFLSSTSERCWRASPHGCGRRSDAHRPRPRESRDRAAGACGRGARPTRLGEHDAHGYAPFRGLPELREALAERYRDPCTASSSTPSARSRSFPGTKTAIVELCLALAEEGQTVVLPDPYYPDYPSGPALAGADIAYVPLDPGNGLAARLLAGSRRERRGRLPQLPVQPGCRRRAAGGVRGGGRLRRRPPAPRSCTTLPTATSSSTGASPRASSPRRARRRSASRCSRCPSPTAWPAGGSGSSSATRRSSSGSTCSTTTAASGSSGRFRRPASRR